MPSSHWSAGYFIGNLPSSTALPAELLWAWYTPIIFYWEWCFTKIHVFVKKTSQEVVHTHYFILGMIVLLLLLLLEKNFSFTSAKTDRILVVYHAGLNLTAVMLMVRGVTQVLGTALSSGMDAAISGMGGIGHILLGVSLVLLLLQIRRSISNANA